MDHFNDVAYVFHRPVWTRLSQLLRRRCNFAEDMLPTITFVTYKQGPNQPPIIKRRLGITN